MKCDYCGRFMSLVDFGAAYGTEWVCSQQAKHVADDPEHWTHFGDELTPLSEDSQPHDTEAKSDDK